MSNPDLDEFDEVLPPNQVGLVVIEIGDRSDLSERQALIAGNAWRGALRHYPDARFDWSLSGYDDDPRDIWEIPEAARYVRWWAHHAGLDDLETATRVFGADPDYCLGGLAACGVFGEEVRRRIVVVHRGAGDRP